MPKVPKIRSLHIFTLSTQKLELKWLFCLEINTKVLCKVILFWVCITKLAQSTKNNKFAMSLQYLKENGKKEVDFLLADKHQRFFEISGCVSPDMPNLLIITTLLFLCNISRKKLDIKLVFCMQISMEVSYKWIL